MGMRLFVKSRFTSFKYALKGVSCVIKKESNFQLQMIIAIGVIFLGLYLQINQTEWFWIIFAIAIGILMNFPVSSRSS